MTETPSSFAALRAATDANGGIHQTTVRTLRNLVGQARMSRGIAERIEVNLDAVGLRYLPPQIPDGQDDVVVLHTDAEGLAGVIGLVRRMVEVPAGDRRSVTAAAQLGWQLKVLRGEAGS
ncbi:hypothetical protein [Kitasatospora sp. NPDC057223]|uniref:hypothetical protein n=1 Tax=Kitasatospora sp. NPDC057223 TaxID=3346055 RepID=UPI003629065D